MDQMDPCYHNAVQPGQVVTKGAIWACDDAGDHVCISKLAQLLRRRPAA